jgi:tetratricopeptide (TPR) repeat protein
MVEEDARKTVNNLPGTVTGQVVQAGSVRDIHLHPRWEPVVPAQLPSAPSVLPCRDRELAQLDSWRDEALIVVSGPGGIGKTALALHWLHHVRENYPDGQLYVDLGAFDVDGPVPPETVLEWFLSALGLPAEEIPAGLPQREAVFRSVTANRSITLLLDNAVSAAQVRPLLPSTRSGLAVVTSQWRLSGLAMQGRHLDVAHWTVDQSVNALTELVGPDRVSAEPEAARRIASACGGLPIAVATVAARLRTRPRRTFTHEAAALQERSKLLKMSPDGDPSLQSVFDASYAGLTTLAAEVYRLCGLHPAGRFGLDVVAEVSTLSLDEVEDGLDELVDCNLLIEEDQDRLRFHDLLREHALAAARWDTAELERDTLTRNFVEWYLASTIEANDVVHPHRWRLEPRFATDSLTHKTFNDRRAAMRWLEVERQAIRGALSEAERRGWFDLVWRFGDALWGFFLHHRHYDDWIQVQRLAIAAAKHCEHRLAEARLHSQLGYAYAKLGRYQEAITENELALRLAKAEKHGPSIATAISQLGRAARGLNDLDLALGYYRQAAELQERLGIERGVALCRRRAGDVLAQLGRVDEAIVELAAAAEMMARLNDPIQYARTVTVLGSLHGRRGRPAEGLKLLRNALAVVREQESPHYIAETLLSLGDLEAQLGETALSLEHLSEAKGLFEAAQDPRVEAVTSLLADLRSR